MLLLLQNSDLTEVLQITHDLVINNEHKDRIHMISANSCNLLRFICEIPIVFYSYFHTTTFPSPLMVSTHVANLKNLYTVCFCRDMGLPINKVLVACHPESAVKDFINHGKYQIHTSSSFDKKQLYFAHSNFERFSLTLSLLYRLLFHILKKDVSEYMTILNRGGR